MHNAFIFSQNLLKFFIKQMLKACEQLTLTAGMVATVVALKANATFGHVITYGKLEQYIKPASLEIKFAFRLFT